MPIHHLPLLFLLLLLPLLPTTLAQCPDVLTLTDKVINGNPSVPSYQVSLSSPATPTIRRCTASRISASWALTAAHCAVNTSWAATIAGPTIYSGAAARVLEVHPYPAYRQPTDRRFDIALVKLDTTAAPGNGGLVKLNDLAELPLPEAFVRVAGYGAIDTSATPNFGNLTHVDIPVVPFPQCRQLYKGTPNLGMLDPDNQLCAGYPQGGCDACSGDSGGPVVQFDQQGNAVQVALISASRGCALPGFPGIGVRVDAFLPWITEFGIDFATGRGQQVVKAPGGTFVTTQPPRDDTDTQSTDDTDVKKTPPPSVTPTPVIVATPKPAAPEQPQPQPQQPQQPQPEVEEDRLPTPSPVLLSTPSSSPKPADRPPRKEKGVGKPVGPRLPPVRPPPSSGGETIEGFEEEEPAASMEPGATGALAGDAAVGAELTGRVSGGAIAGGVVGGLVLVALAIAGLLFVYKNRENNSSSSGGGGDDDDDQTPT